MRTVISTAEENNYLENNQIHPRLGCKCSFSTTMSWMPPGGGKKRGWPVKRKVDSNYSFQLLLLSRGWKYLFRKDFIRPDLKSTNDILPIQFSINFTLPTESFDTDFRQILTYLSSFEHYFGVNLWRRTVLIPIQSAVKILTVDNPIFNGVIVLTILCRMN